MEGGESEEECDEENARVDGELFEQSYAGELASMDEQTAREVMRNRTGRKVGDPCWGSGAKVPQAALAKLRALRRSWRQR